MLQIPTEARFCFNPPVCPPLLGSMGHQVLPRLNRQGRTIDAILPGGNCLFRSISKSLFGTSSGHLHLRKLMVTFIKSNLQLLGGLCNPPSIENIASTWRHQGHLVHRQSFRQLHPCFKCQYTCTKNQM